MRITEAKLLIAGDGVYKHRRGGDAREGKSMKSPQQAPEAGKQDPSKIPEQVGRKAQMTSRCA